MYIYYSAKSFVVEESIDDCFDNSFETFFFNSSFLPSYQDTFFCLFADIKDKRTSVFFMFTYECSLNGKKLLKCFHTKS